MNSIDVHIHKDEFKFKYSNSHFNSSKLSQVIEVPFKL